MELLSDLLFEPSEPENFGRKMTAKRDRNLFGWKECFSCFFLRKCDEFLRICDEFKYK